MARTSDRVRVPRVDYNRLRTHSNSFTSMPSRTIRVKENQLTRLEELYQKFSSVKDVTQEERIKIGINGNSLWNWWRRR